MGGIFSIRARSECILLGVFSHYFPFFFAFLSAHCSSRLGGEASMFPVIFMHVRPNCSVFGSNASCFPRSAPRELRVLALLRTQEHPPSIFPSFLPGNRPALT